MLKFKDIIDMISRKKAPNLSKGFWHRFDSELGKKLDAIDDRNLSHSYGFAEAFNGAFSIFLRPKPVLVTATLVLVINLTLFSFANKGIPLTAVAFLSNNDLAEELVLTDELSSGENVVDF